jgi:anti-sigma factor RsiW
MTAHPTSAELLRYVEGDLPAARAQRIRKLESSDRELAAEIERVRADAAMAPSLRDAAGDAETVSAEKRIEAALTDSVTRTSRTKGRRSR